MSKLPQASGENDFVWCFSPMLSNKSTSLWLSPKPYGSTPSPYDLAYNEVPPHKPVYSRSRWCNIRSLSTARPSTSLLATKAMCTHARSKIQKVKTMPKRGTVWLGFHLAIARNSRRACICKFIDIRIKQRLHQQ